MIKLRKKIYKLYSGQEITFMNKYILAFFIYILSCCAPLALKHNENNPPEGKEDQHDSIGVNVKSGLENFLENYTHLVRNKRIGLITNQTGIDSDFNSTIDLFNHHPQINLTTLFALEHGLRGDNNAGEKFNDQIDPRTTLPIYSLYGKTRKPSVKMLQSTDVLIFDMQDAGVRSYTYISSMGIILEAAAENNKELIILDRPNPLGGNKVEGNILQEEYKSHVGYYKIPYCHGMTMGEIAQMYNTENHVNAKLTVIPVMNWKREMLWVKTGLPWVPTSPHVPHWRTTLFLPLTGIIGELQTVNNGVGYTSPFELIGAPWIEADQLADSLNKLNLPGLYFRATHYKPYYATYKNELCHGVQIYITDVTIYQPFFSGLSIISTLMRLYPENGLFAHSDRVKMFNLVMGGKDIHESLLSAKPVQQIAREWQAELDNFLKIRKLYLIY